MGAPAPRRAAVARRRLPLLALGAAALLAGLWSGLARLGAVAAGPVSPMDHGPLMVGGFLGTVIALERAVAARAAWAYAGPLLCCAGTVALLSGRWGPGAALLTAGSAVVVAVLVRVVVLEPALHHGVLALAAAGWLGGNALLAAGRPVFEVVPLWLLFLVGTIAAERLELNRLLPRTPATVAAFVVAVSTLAAGAVAAVWARDLGFRVLGAGALLLAAWLARHDIARRTVRQEGVTRFIAVALLAGYVWLAVTGVLALWLGHPLAGPRYDALLHAAFVGFVFSMIFGHAPVILPAVLGVRVPWRPRFYAHLALLHAAVAARVVVDLLGATTGRQVAGWVSAAAIVLFLGSTAVAVLGGGAGPVAGPPAVRDEGPRGAVGHHHV